MVNPVGIFVIALGLPVDVWPAKVARIEEQVDAIGSKHSLSEVEPADWKVTLNRLFGGAFVLFGLFVLFS